MALDAACAPQVRLCERSVTFMALHRAAPTVLLGIGRGQAMKAALNAQPTNVPQTWFVEQRYLHINFTHTHMKTYAIPMGTPQTQNLTKFMAAPCVQLAPFELTLTMLVFQVAYL